MAEAEAETAYEKWLSLQKVFETGVTLEGFADVIADNCVIHEDLNLPEPLARDWHGPQGFMDLMDAIPRTIPAFEYESTGVVSNENYLAFKGLTRGNLPGGSFETTVFEFWTFENGKAVDVLVAWRDAAHIKNLHAGTGTATP